MTWYDKMYYGGIAGFAAGALTLISSFIYIVKTPTYPEGKEVIRALELSNRLSSREIVLPSDRKAEDLLKPDLRETIFGEVVTDLEDMRNERDGLLKVHETRSSLSDFKERQKRVGYAGVTGLCGACLMSVSAISFGIGNSRRREREDEEKGIERSA